MEDEQELSYSEIKEKEKSDWDQATEKADADKQDSQKVAPSWLNCKYKGYCYYSKCECDL